jgi:hypothetical protein
VTLRPAHLKYSTRSICAQRAPVGRVNGSCFTTAYNFHTRAVPSAAGDGAGGAPIAISEGAAVRRRCGPGPQGGLPSRYHWRGHSLMSPGATALSVPRTEALRRHSIRSMRVPLQIRPRG